MSRQRFAPRRRNRLAPIDRPARRAHGGLAPAADRGRPRISRALRGRGLAALLAVALPAAAACDTQTPLERLQAQLETYPEYSVILQDMDEDLFGYSHQYQVVVGAPQPGSDELVYREALLDWQPVDSGTYERYRPFLGMVVLSKSPGGNVDQDAHPPGYQQVGDERYGQWRQDSSGRSFWEFYGQYALLSHIMGGFGRPIYRDDWNGYQESRNRGQTYYGPGTAGGGRTYGTSGTTTRQSNPDFFRRQQARQAAQSRSFGQRVSSRMAGGMRSFGK